MLLSPVILALLLALFLSFRTDTLLNTTNLTSISRAFSWIAIVDVYGMVCP